MPARKSSLSEYGLSLIQDSPDATLDMKSGKWLAMDGTVRGLRDAFKAFQRGGVRSCEVSATYKTSDSPPNQTGVHYLNKTKVCTWAHSERDGNLTGNGSNAVRDYLFFHDVSGQVEVIEEVMCPHNDGFFKRFDFTISPDEPACDENQMAVDSQALIKSHFSWLYKNAFETPGDICLSGPARSLYRAFSSAVSDFMTDEKERLGGWLSYKLRYRDTDVLRYAAASMRVVQSLSSLATSAADVPSHTRREVDVVELMYALNRWRRQVHIVAAYIRVMEQAAKTMPMGDAGGCRVPHSALRSLAKPVTSSMTGLSLIKQLLLKKAPKEDTTDSKVARAQLKDVQAIRREKMPNLAGLIKGALIELAECQLISIEHQDARVCRYKKMSWRQLPADARAEAQRLQCEDAFL